MSDAIRFLVALVLTTLAAGFMLYAPRRRE